MSEQIEYQSRAGRLVFDYRKAAYLPDKAMLLVADLHFEKGSYLQAYGKSPLPAYDTADTLERLQQLIGQYRPDHVAALGDSFHDIQAGERISARDHKALNGLIAQVPKFTWILGNHDPDIPDGLRGDQQDHLQCGDFLLTHLPTDTEGNMGVNLCGHLHPKVRISTRLRNLSRPCFAVSENRIILPSFGTYTGGLAITHEAITSELIGETVYFAIHNKDIVPLSG